MVYAQQKLGGQLNFFSTQNIEYEWIQMRSKQCTKKYITICATIVLQDAPKVPGITAKRIYSFFLTQ